MGNAAGKLREECDGAWVGLDATESGGAEPTAPLGDLATIVASYDQTQGFSSNGVSSYFHDLGWRQRAHDLIARDWLALNPEVSGDAAVANASLGGNYGEPSPSPSFGFELETANGKRDDRTGTGSSCEAEPDSPPEIYVNSLTALALAEAHRRIALHRETTDSLPSAKWADVQAMLYGAGRDASAMFPDGLDWGGMSADPAIFIQDAFDSALGMEVGQRPNNAQPLGNHHAAPSNHAATAIAPPCHATTRATRQPTIPPAHHPATMPPHRP